MSAARAVWSALDRRAVAAWADFESTGGANQDRTEFTERIHRKGWAHAYPPQILSAEAADDVATVGVRLAELVSGFPQRVFGEDLAAWAEYLGASADDAALMTEALASPRLAKVARAFMRPDLVVTDEGLKLVELNVATSLGGLSTCAPYTRAARSSAYARFLESRGLGLDAPDTSRVWLEVFGGLTRRHTDGPLHVFEATANPADIDSGRRFFVDMVRSAGHQVSCGLVHHLELTDEGVYFEGRRIDAVFTAYTWHETRRFVPPALTRRLMELDAAGKVDFIGSPAAGLFDNKANLALLFEYASLLTNEERTLVERHVPETFRLSEETLERAVAAREQLLCKPASAYGGKDMRYGFPLDDTAWRALLTECLRGSAERHVLQYRVPPAVVELPGASPSAREVVLAPLVFGGRFAGTFLRQAPPREESVINASSGAESAGVLSITARER
ncbi:hypothetical protein OG599_15135 [Streptomyces sp. NBC_01335]|uniref:hypothetical protein n=1 Tax=Streptomyces sp. NBC_01335 TaxID=2903828 RepID=UPI002E0D280B|nr:hypothetical protein OG599_15135 [Streptomyces sp. NBC_01335]